MTTSYLHDRVATILAADESGEAFARALDLTIGRTIVALVETAVRRKLEHPDSSPSLATIIARYAQGACEHDREIAAAHLEVWDLASRDVLQSLARRD